MFVFASSGCFRACSLARGGVCDRIVLAKAYLEVNAREDSFSYSRSAFSNQILLPLHLLSIGIIFVCYFGRKARGSPSQWKIKITFSCSMSRDRFERTFLLKGLLDITYWKLNEIYC